METEQDPKNDTRTLPETQAARHRDILQAIVATKRRELEALGPEIGRAMEKAFKHKHKN